MLLLLVVLHHSLTAGALAPECADALRGLTASIFERAAITHVTSMDPGILRDRAVADPSLVRVSEAIAYTIEGPRNEVAIVVCAPGTPPSPPPAPAADSSG